MDWGVNVAIMMNCQHCQKYIGAYLDDELKPAVRRQVAAHLRDCEICYVAYCQQRELQHELAHYVPQIGVGKYPAFERVWGALQQDAARPQAPMRYFRKRYSLVLAAIALIFIVPLTMGNGQLKRVGPPTQPAPVTAHATPNSTEPNPTAAALSMNMKVSWLTPEPKHSVFDPPPMNTPATRMYDNSR
jgi:predicted anti-sigma-YlaC factor YlaD